MSGTDLIPVIAFTDNKLPFQNIDIAADLDIKFCTSLDHFFEEILSGDFSGVILEMRKVMQTPANDRNKVFSLAANKPVMRIKIKAGKVGFIDDLAEFKTNCIEKKKGQIRRFDRANVNIQVKLSHEYDHAMAQPISATIINISESGCFFRTETDFSNQKFINIKFDTLEDKLPVYAAIRWKTTPKNNFIGYGVQFVSIKENQKHDILEKYINPQLAADNLV
ncbi:PilZ domain-containing protein [Maridesulfovibrio zosterae]|uniref:PilZ domain-containing protein n=1 Tax=Maridesulfovibrio zosterae TaxID=82171 RepID=UPI0004207F61|nr:PilZ domain-containing protein [Maridesulfovibrio zosterae]